MDKIAAGEAFVLNEDGRPQMQFFATGPALAIEEFIGTWAEMFVIAGMREPANGPDLEAIRSLAAKLAGDEALTESDVVACRACLLKLRRYAGRLTSSEIEDLAQTVVLRAQMDELDDLHQAG